MHAACTTQLPSGSRSRLSLNKPTAILHRGHTSTNKLPNTSVSTGGTQARRELVCASAQLIHKPRYRACGPSLYFTCVATSHTRMKSDWQVASHGPHRNTYIYSQLCACSSRHLLRHVTQVKLQQKLDLSTSASGAPCTPEE